MPPASFQIKRRELQILKNNSEYGIINAERTVVEMFRIRQTRTGWIDALMETTKGILAIGVFAILFGIFFAVVSMQNMNIVPREEAVAYEGEFDKFREGKNWSTLYFTDGTEYELFPHTIPREFRDRMERLEKGTKLYLLINPNTTYVAEVKTESEELLDFETSQQDVKNYQFGYIGIGGFVVLGGVFLIVYAILGAHNEKKGKQKSKKRASQKTPLRQASQSKGRILLEARKGNYNICYRRVGIVNELVINGDVWDEYRAVVEFEHCLAAVIDGNKIEAGYSEDGESYIAFNGHWIAEKQRWI